MIICQIINHFNSDKFINRLIEYHPKTPNDIFLHDLITEICFTHEISQNRYINYVFNWSVGQIFWMITFDIRLYYEGRYSKNSNASQPYMYKIRYTLVKYICSCHHILPVNERPIIFHIEIFKSSFILFLLKLTLYIVRVRSEMVMMITFHLQFWTIN